MSTEIIELTEILKKIKWPVDYATIKLQIRAGKATLVTFEKTVRLD